MIAASKFTRMLLLPDVPAGSIPSPGVETNEGQGIRLRPGFARQSN